MKRLLKLATILILCGAGSAFAHGGKVGPIKIDHPWSRATVPVVPTGVAYFVLRNSSQEGDRLPELHTHIHEGDVVRMRKLDAIEIAPASTVALEPGGLHVMLIKLKQPLVKGQSFPLTLVFERAGSVTIQVDVRDITDTSSSQTSHGHGGHGHGGHKH